MKITKYLPFAKKTPVKLLDETGVVVTEYESSFKPHELCKHLPEILREHRESVAKVVIGNEEYQIEELLTA